MKVYTSKRTCSGCGACKESCPCGAIEMREDEEGFCYPEISPEKCIDCGACQRVCFYRQEYEKKRDALERTEFYAVKHKDDGVRRRSQSGGAFTALSDAVLAKGGVIYGAAFDGDFSVSHKRAETREERDKFRGSKYVQSNLQDTFRKAKNDLANGRMVLFSGTPCQIEGLKKYLGDLANRSALILVDLICHGTPSPKIWRSYLVFLRLKYKGTIERVNFRDKKFGWGSHVETFSFHGRDYNDRSYTNLFYGNFILRPSCHDCKFASRKRCSDITIADCWGIEKHLPRFQDSLGVSLLMINTISGRNLLEEIRENFWLEKYSLEQCSQPHLYQSAEISPRREKFWQDYQRLSFEQLLKKYAEYGWRARVWRKLKNLMKKSVLVRAVWQWMRK